METYTLPWKDWPDGLYQFSAARYIKTNGQLWFWPEGGPLKPSMFHTNFKYDHPKDFVRLGDL